MEFQDVIQNRMSIRSFEQRKVEDDKISYIINCARLAPSWINKQCWRFIVVQDKSRIEALAKTSIINRWLKHVPCILVGCGDPTESGNRDDIPYFTVDVAIAMEHIILAATDVGLGSCWIGGFNEQKVKEILDIPKRIRVIALTPLGYPAEKKKILDKTAVVIAGSKKRKSIQEITRYERW
jgi:nitroreductase